MGIGAYLPQPNLAEGPPDLAERQKEGFILRLRKQALGTRNMVGARVELARKNQGMKQRELLAKLQVTGVDMNASGLSKLEGQIRYVTDFELAALANILNVSVDWLLGRGD